MFRLSKLSITAVLLITVHAFIIAAFHSSQTSAFLSEFIELVAAVLAVATCFRASYKSQELPRSLWFLLGTGYAFWSAGMVLDLFNSYYLHSSDPNPPLILFVFFFSVAPLLLAIFQFRQDDSGVAYWIGLLDAAQGLILLSAGYLFYFYVLTPQSGQELVVARLQLLHYRNVFLAVGLIARAVFPSSREARRFFAPVAMAFAFYTVSSWFGNQASEVWGVNAGGWADLAWSIPFAMIAIAAAEWRYGLHSQEKEAIGELKDLRKLVLIHMLPIGLPVAVIFLAHRAMHQQFAIATAVVVISFACFVTRLTVTQYHRDALIGELEAALGNVKMLSGLLPICASCKMIRDEEGKWNQLESYIQKNSEADFSHGICPGCAEKLFPEFLNG